MKYNRLFFGMLTWVSGSNLLVSATESITPYKFTDAGPVAGYQIPASARFTLSRDQQVPITPLLHPTAPLSDIVYYLSMPPHTPQYSLALVVGGSSSKNSLSSIMHLHRYFLQEFTDLGIGVVTIEQAGVDGDSINEDEFFEYYTRTQRLIDHRTVMDHLIAHPPAGWNGKFVLWGVSEGGPLVTRLTQEYSDRIMATMNYCGAGDWSWHEELWAFVGQMRQEIAQKGPWWARLWDQMPRWMPFAPEWPATRVEYAARMDDIRRNPVIDQYYLGMTYRYHADALAWPDIAYDSLQTPFLVIAGALDSIILSSDQFVTKAQAAGVPITYMRVDDMDHYVRRRSEVLARSFAWLADMIAH